MSKMPVNVLLDRDGTVIEERHYLSDPGQVRLTPGAGQALTALTRAGCRLFLVTNQSGLGRGYFSHVQYQAVQDRLEEMLRPLGAAFTTVAVCPHAPEDRCSCRKPLTGLWETLRRDFNILPEHSVMIGDKAVDVLFGRACSLAASILVLIGHGSGTARDMGLPDLRDDWMELPSPAPDHPHVLARDLAAASRWILQR